MFGFGFHVSFPEFFNDRTLKRFWTEDLRFDGGDEDAERKQIHGFWLCFGDEDDAERKHIHGLLALLAFLEEKTLEEIDERR